MKVETQIRKRSLTWGTPFWVKEGGPSHAWVCDKFVSGFLNKDRLLGTFILSDKPFKGAISIWARRNKNGDIHYSRKPIDRPRSSLFWEFKDDHRHLLPEPNKLYQFYIAVK